MRSKKWQCEMGWLCFIVGGFAAVAAVDDVLLALSRGAPKMKLAYQEIDSVAFAFYNDEEVLAIIVKKHSNPILYDNMKNCLGPLESCETCSLRGIKSV
ncbi:unnamed protein product [Calypogeia fissa]